ncbi:MAG: HlyD family efflux transporter periplasmic adaptor subunit [Deltaproteobacteria bacterium]|nr:HlyD family efflux transporter periplasmic adaptor subunit [Deltaproteobacteria bacterium]
MPHPFHRALRALGADGRAVWLGAVLLLLALGMGWAAWFLFARVTVTEVSAAARLEVERAPHPLELAAGGRLLRSRLVLGARVRAGEVLVELDAERERILLREERLRVQSVEAQLALLRQELRTGEAALGQYAKGTTQAMGESRAQQREAEAISRFAQQKSKELTGLTSEGLVSRLEGLAARAESERRLAEAEKLRLAIDRLSWSRKTSTQDRLMALQRLRRHAAALEGAAASARASMDRLSHEIERRRVRAPVDGRLGEVATLRVGAVLREGERVGVVLPDGGLKIVADFLPHAALGRVRPGQLAHLRLDGFPWTQFGVVHAKVSAVAGEVRAGRVRVELGVQPDPSSRIPLQHGLPGLVQVEIEELSPASLVARAAGRLLGRGVPR